MYELSALALIYGFCDIDFGFSEALSPFIPFVLTGSSVIGIVGLVPSN